jgi:Na+/H+ antiporter NhaC
MKTPSTPVSIVLALVLVGGLVHCGAEPLVPPLLAIFLALVTKQVLFSLLIGVLLGSILHHNSFFIGGARVFDTYIVDALTKRSHASIILFSMALAGMVGVISRSGGTRGIVKTLVKYARGPRSGQVATWFMGLFIFFDDYANTLVVGNTMRPLTDKLRISREKLSYIVDSTSAPVASLALISTWIGYEISLITDSFAKCGITKWTGYAAFLESIPYRFYCILTLVMVLAVAYLLRDFGPMAEAEKRCRQTGQALAEGAHPLSSFTSEEVEPPEGTPLRWYNAVIPIGTLIVMTMCGLYWTGCHGVLADAQKSLRLKYRQDFIHAEKVERKGELDAKAFAQIEQQVANCQEAIDKEAWKTVSSAPLRNIIAKADSSRVLLWSAFTCSLLAIFLPFVQGIGGGLEKLFDAWVAGAKSMVLATMILILAWSLGSICEHLHTADFIVSYAKNVVSPWVLPGLTFTISAAMAFATGTSWGTMSIVLPLAIPLAHKLGLDQALAPAVYQSVLFGTIGAVLSGACFGDHCSPISDTTIMSSMASGCDHVDHVRTQLPYALVAAGGAVLLCYVPAGFGFSPFVTIPLGMAGVIAFLYFVGEPTDDESLGVVNND